MSNGVILVNLEGEFAGWNAQLRRSVSARILIELQGDPTRQFTAFEKLVISHNFKDADGNAVESVLDAPITALTQTMEKWTVAISEIPNA